MSFTRSMRAMLVIFFFVVAAPVPTAGGEPTPALAQLVKRTLSDGTCLDQGDQVVCSLQAVLREGHIRNAGGDLPPLPYEVVYLSVLVVPTGDTLIIEEVFGQRERWMQEGDATVVEQLLVSYWGPSQGQSIARRVQLNGSTLLKTSNLPPAAGDVQSVWTLLIRLFLSTRL